MIMRKVFIHNVVVKYERCKWICSNITAVAVRGACAYVAWVQIIGGWKLGWRRETYDLH